jgi:hypothetical protein
MARLRTLSTISKSFWQLSPSASLVAATRRHCITKQWVDQAREVPVGLGDTASTRLSWTSQKICIEKRAFRVRGFRIRFKKSRTSSVARLRCGRRSRDLRGSWSDTAGGRHGRTSWNSISSADPTSARRVQPLQRGPSASRRGPTRGKRRRLRGNAHDRKTSPSASHRPFLVRLNSSNSLRFPRLFII